MLRSELWTCSQASKRVLPQEADCSNGIEGNGYPHTTQFRTLQSDMNALIQREGLLAGTPSIRRIRKCSHLPRFARVKGVYPSAFGTIRKTYSGTTPKVSCPKKNEVIIRPSDFATESFLRRLGFPIQKLANYFFPLEFPRA